MILEYIENAKSINADLIMRNSIVSLYSPKRARKAERGGKGTEGFSSGAATIGSDHINIMQKSKTGKQDFVTTDGQRETAQERAELKTGLVHRFVH